MDQEYETLGDPDEDRPPTARERQVLEAAERSAAVVARMHFHEVTIGKEAGAFISHTHDDDELGHVHAGRLAAPLSVDGGYREEMGPSLGRALPTQIAPHGRRILMLRGTRASGAELMRWRLRLFCGHVAERTAHRSYTSAARAFTGSVPCPECGLNPATILAARPVGLAG